MTVVLAPTAVGAFLCGIPLQTLVTEPLANGKTADLPGLDGTAQIALATAVDLADSALPRKIDDHVTFAGMETDPGQETDKPIIVAACVLRIVSDLTDVRRVHLEEV